MVSVILTGDPETPGWVASKKSIQQQTYRSFELIESPISYANWQLAVARNRGYLNSAGKYLLFVNAGDVLHKNFLKKTVEQAAGYQANALVGVATDVVGTHMSHYYSVDNFFWQNQLFVETLISRALFELVDGFRVLQTEPAYDAAIEEWDFWVRAMRAGMIVLTVSEPLLTPAEPDRLDRTRVYASMFQRRHADLFNTIFELVPLEEADKFGQPLPAARRIWRRVKTYFQEIFA